MRGITLMLDNDLHKRLKMAAAYRETNISKIIRDSVIYFTECTEAQMKEETENGKEDRS